MKLLIFANVDGELSTVNKLFAKHPEVTLAISLGDLHLFSESTPLAGFLREKYRLQGERSIGYNLRQFRFTKPVYHIYGSTDDPFIPPPELRIGLLNPIWNGIVPIQTDSGGVKKLGFLGGYYSSELFSPINKLRNKEARKKQSLALCGMDFEPLRDDFDYLFTYESPYGKPFDRRGCPGIWPLVDRSKITFYGHHRVLQIDEKYNVVGMPPLEYGYAILDTSTGKYTIYFKTSCAHDYTKLRSGGVLCL